MKTLFASFQARLFACFLAVTVLAMLIPIFYVRPVLHEALLQDSLERLRQEALLVRALLAAKPDAAVSSALDGILRRTETRLTVMDGRGEVLFESARPEGRLAENHADRPEVRAAVRTGQGSATRFSTTLDRELIYAALRLEDGGIIRLSVPFAGVERRIEAQLAGLFLAAGASIALALLLAWYLSRRVKLSLTGMIRLTEDMSLGRFHRRLHRLPGREFQPLADAVNRMAGSVEESLTALADQKNQLEAVLDTMAEGVLVFDLKGRVRRANNAFVGYFPQADAPAGRQAVEVAFSPALQTSVAALLADPDGHGKTAALQITSRSGTVFSVLLARPLEPAAESLGLVAVFRDITELVRLEAVRRDFVANVSHELRTPLTAVQGYAETLAGLEELPEQARRFAEIIRKHGLFLSGLVDELLTLSRLEGDGFRPAAAPVSPAEALRRAARLLQPEMERKRLRLTVKIAPDLRVLAEAGPLERVFRNLLENACRYADEGGAITVSAQAKDAEVVFSVADQGPGIPAAELGRVFERFYRVEKHRGASGKGGSGLGLAICKHIVERYRGRIWAESPAGEYATVFCFTLPPAAPGAGEEDA